MNETLRANVDSFREYIDSQGWTLESEKEIQSGYQLVVSDGESKLPVNFYTTGKALVQGKAGELRDGVQAWWDQRSVIAEGKRSVIAEGERIGGTTSATSAGAGQVTARVGLDESGKGDYFGPLVIGAVYVDERAEPALKALGVRDSKRLPDGRIQTMAAQIRATCPHSVVAIGPKRYNELYERSGNLNKLLAWGHARALENVLEEVPAGVAVADQFGDESFLLNALLERGRRIRLVQRPRAEEDTAVAAASLLARAEFVRRLEQLSDAVGRSLPKGASDPAIVEVGREIVARGGQAALAEVAKLHFKTTREIMDDGR
jgi:ribonuclease HIII